MGDDLPWDTGRGRDPESQKLRSNVSASISHTRSTCRSEVFSSEMGQFCLGVEPGQFNRTLSTEVCR